MKISLFLTLALIILTSTQSCSDCNTAQYCLNVTCYDCASITSSNAANCQKCPGYFLQQNSTCLTCDQAAVKTECVNCRGFFWRNSSNTCSYCWQATGQAQCQLCHSSDYVYFADSDFCSSCSTLFGDQCHQLCPFYYYDWDLYQCLACRMDMDAQQCSKCTNFIHIEQEGCIKCIQAINGTECLCQNYLYNQKVDQCYACQQADQMKCQDCVGYVFKESCRPCAGSTDYDHCTNNCPGYYYDSNNGNCVACSSANQDSCLSDICPNYEFQNDTQQCANCIAPTNGSKCLCNHYLLNQTIQQCYSCSQADQTNCKDCIGYIFKDSCQLCEGSWDQERCRNNCTGYHFDSSMGMCTSCSLANNQSCIPEICPNHQFEILTQKCIDCQTSFNQQKKCECLAYYFDPQLDKCIHCSSASQLFCQPSCPGYIFFNTTCEACSQNSNEQLCSKCNGFYYDLSNYVCRGCANAQQAYCNNCSGFTFKYDYNTSLFDTANSSLNGTCTPCYAITDFSQCLTCLDYQFINFTSSCVLCYVANQTVCGECVDYQYITSSCINCLIPQNISECHCKGFFLAENGSESSCKTCHQANQHQCMSCLGYQFDDYCLECLNISDEANCSKCMNAADYYYNNHTKKCLKCPMANSSQQCSLCPTYYFMEQSCISCKYAHTNQTCLCKDHYYDSQASFCTPCQKADSDSCKQLCINRVFTSNSCRECLTVSNQSDCNNCPNYFFNQTKCVSCFLANQEQCNKCLKGGYGFNGSCILCSGLKTPHECSACINFIFLNQSNFCHPCSIPYDGGCACPDYYLDGNSNNCIKCTSSPDASSCSLCPGYAYGNSSCFKCQSADSSQLCSYCPSSVFLNSTCTPCNSIQSRQDCSSCSSQGYDWTSFGCSDCTSLNGTYCTQCQDYAFYNGSCYSCFSATSSQYCSTCPGFQFVNKSCVECLGVNTNVSCQVCPSYYFDQTTTSCERCSFRGNLPIEVCQKCVFFWSEGVCYSSDQCLIVNCASCSSNITCLQCLQGYNNTGGLCTSGPCNISNCYICLSSNVCYQCSSEYQLSSNGTSCLITQCAIPNCDICANSTTCSKCLANYKLTSNGCQLICSVQFCQACSPASNCTSCSASYQIALSGTLCMPSCNISNCELCATFTMCLACNEDYLLAKEDTACQPNCNIPHCTSCQTLSTCAVCEQYYEMNGAGNVCSPAICQIENCQVCESAAACQTCSAGYSLTRSKTCTPICSIIGCARCLSQSQCSYCSIGFTLAANLMACNPLCTIPSCNICLSSTLCGVCAGGYTVGIDGTCVQSCIVNNCRSCSSGKCVQCIDGFSVAQGGSACYPICGWNSISLNGSCISCLSVIDNCISCAASPSETISCQNCAANSYLNANFTCTPCASAITNCFSCSSSTACSQCLLGYSPMAFNGAACSLITTNCQMEYCEKCAPATYCISCISGYVMKNGKCNPISTCSGGQFFDGKSCTCPLFTYQSASICISCPANCILCNSFTCLACTQTYYISAGICVDCPQNCLSCISSSLCTGCINRFSLIGGQCVFFGLTQRGILQTNNNFISCPPNCKSCTLNKLFKVICIETAVGNALSLSGQVVPCLTRCRECSPVNSNMCTRCYHGLGLFNSECIPCMNANCLACPLSAAICISCKDGYAVQGTSCGACSKNCLTCLSSGAGKCDIGGCQVGYTQSIGGYACLKCSNGCATCSSLSVLSCQSCMPSYFINNGSYCLKCPTGCLSCSSATICSTCDSEYVPLNNSCIPIIPFPCISTGINGCLACAGSFQLDVNRSCILKDTCSVTSNCSSCPDTTYLVNGTCVPCPDIANCQVCDSNGIGCVLCNLGYYLSNQSCVKCVSGCYDCQSDKYCNQPADAYFLILYNGVSSGLTAPCSPLCASCLFSSQNCIKCFSGFTLLGSSCVNNANIQVKLVLKPIMKDWNASASSDRKDQQLMQNWNDVQEMLLKITGKPDLSYILITNYAYGSVIVNFNLSPGVDQDPAAAYNNINLNSKPSGTSNFEVVSSTSTAVGFNPPSSSSGANMGLILGVSIPLLLFVVIFMVALKHKFDQDDKSKGNEPKQVTIPPISNNGTERELNKDQMMTV